MVLRSSISLAVVALAFAGSMGVAAGQYYPPQPPPVYPAASSQPYPAGSYASAPLPRADQAYSPQRRPYSAAAAPYAPQSAPTGLRPPAGIGTGTSADITGSVPSEAGAGAPAGTAAALPSQSQSQPDPSSPLPPQFHRQLVDYSTDQPIGTIIVDTPHTYLYLVLGHGTALRYGIGVGREGFTWSGVEHITRMKKWPDWYPPREMIERQPYLPRFMAGGLENPLGARALYLGHTLYRIHGTNQPWTIGTFISSGCIRLTNADIEDLYGRVTIGTKVVVLPGEPPPNMTSAQTSVAR